MVIVFFALHYSPVSHIAKSIEDCQLIYHVLP